MEISFAIFWRALRRSRLKNLAYAVTWERLTGMRRRDFLKTATALIIGGTFAPKVFAETVAGSAATPPAGHAAAVKDYLEKMRRFYEPHAGDVFVEREQLGLVRVCVQRLERLQRTVGHGHFHLLGFDDGIVKARNEPGVGAFPKPELDLLESIFSADATRYGFLGEKSLQRITDRIPTQEVVKVPGSGNYLYKGPPLDAYQKLIQDAGPSVILTSGVRGVMKQFQLFLRKAAESQGNLSLASRSFAPPGFSFHGICDFDVGQTGFGMGNFTERFVSTDVFKRLDALDYLSLRYPQGNPLGVRFEPWHIKVSWKA